MTKADLKTGMFGVMSSGKLFVIVNDLIVYESGGFDLAKHLNDDLSFGCYHIDLLVEAQSFMQTRIFIKEKLCILYDRKAEKAKIETVMTIAEIEEKLGVKNLRIKGE